jgi:hypothetical protein
LLETLVKCIGSAKQWSFLLLVTYVYLNYSVVLMKWVY